MKKFVAAGLFLFVGVLLFAVGFTPHTAKAANPYLSNIQWGFDDNETLYLTAHVEQSLSNTQIGLTIGSTTVTSGIVTVFCYTYCSYIAVGQDITAGEDVTFHFPYFWNICSGQWVCERHIDALTRQDLINQLGLTVSPASIGHISVGGWQDNTDYIVTGIAAIPSFGSPLSQFKSDVTTQINEGGTTTEDTVIFGATLQSSSTNQLRLEVEYTTSTTFAGIANVTSSPVNPGSFATTTASNLQNGSYRWRARTVDTITQATSDWQEFGTAGNTDFVVHQVPLYTQRESDYPSVVLTRDWAARQYGNGDYDCINSNGSSTIGSCGCAITALVMVSRYHKALTDINGQDINPKSFNDWLTSVTAPTSTIGYTNGGGVWWASIDQYTNGEVVFTTSTDSMDLGLLSSKLDEELDFLRPTVLYESNVRGGHYLVADSKLAATYHIRDPYFYNTKYLTGGSNSTVTHNYNNQLSGIRAFKQGTAGFIPASISFALASPAELLVTDPNGNRLGLDPVSNISYDEISGGSYFADSIGSGPDDGTSIGHQVKMMWIPSPASGTYNIQVIGIAGGTYTFQGLVYDASGTAHPSAFTGITGQNQETDYVLKYTPDSPQGISTKEIYKFLGFLSPIKADGSGIYKLGRTLPVKFQLKNANNEPVSTAVAKLFISKIQDGIEGTVEVPFSTSGADSGNIFRYDSADKQYIYNLSTSGLSRGTWQIRVELDDGKSYTVLVSLRG
jgi:hypothetical protein